MPKKVQKFELRLKKFDITSIRKDSTVVFVGKRRSGKSYTLRELLYNLRDLPAGVIISGTEEASPFFSDFVPSSYIYNKFDEVIPEKILKTQKKKIKRARKRGKDPKKDKFFFILDDCLYDNTWQKTEVIRELFMNGRHYNMFFVLTMQYPLGIPPTLRSNIDYSFIYQDYNTENREKLYKSFAGAFGDRHTFYTAMDSLGDFECIVIDNTVRTRNITDRVFYYKAPVRDGSFKVGCEAYWKKHELLYNRQKQNEEDSDSEDDELIVGNERQDISHYKGTTKRNVDIRVRKYNH